MQFDSALLSLLNSLKTKTKNVLKRVDLFFAFFYQ